MIGTTNAVGGGVIDEINKDATTLKETVDGHTTSIGTLETDMNSVESDLATHQTSINEIAGSVSSALSRISTNESTISSLSSNKQDKLVSGTNIKTVNGNSIVGSGNVTIEAGKTYTAGSGISISSSGVISTTVPIGTYSKAFTASLTILDDIKLTIAPTSSLPGYPTITTQKIGNNVTTSYSGTTTNTSYRIMYYDSTSETAINVTIDLTPILGNINKNNCTISTQAYSNNLYYNNDSKPIEGSITNGIFTGSFKTYRTSWGSIVYYGIYVTTTSFSKSFPIYIRSISTTD